MNFSINSLLSYYQACNSFNPHEISYTDYYYKLFNLKEDCMLRRDGRIKCEGEDVLVDKIMSSADKSQVLLDWLHAIGGSALVEHVFQVYSKDLEGETLHDLKQHLLDSIMRLKIEAEKRTEARSATICTVRSTRKPALHPCRQIKLKIPSLPKPKINSALRRPRFKTCHCLRKEV